MSKRIRRRNSWARFKTTDPKPQQQTEQENQMDNKTYEEKMAELNAPYVGGPRSSEGKEKSPQNSTKHSLCANNVRFVKDGEEDIYKAIEAIWFNSYQPRDEAEKHLVRH
jgi:hypothetical protein